MKFVLVALITLAGFTSAADAGPIRNWIKKHHKPVATKPACPTCPTCPKPVVKVQVPAVKVEVVPVRPFKVDKKKKDDCQCGPSCPCKKK